ncbi:hypothetical protein Tco_1145398 [Tanacetum coccineum]
MVAYLQKSEGSEGFHEIIDFLSASHISYALTENPTIYISFIKQFWNTAATSTRENGEVQLTATIDGHENTLTEASLRRHLKLEDNGGVTSLSNSEIFEQLGLIGYVIDSDKLTFQMDNFSPQWRFLIHTILHCITPKKTSWEQFSSNVATAIICLATNRTYNFSKMIFDAMVKNVESLHKFFMYPRITSSPSLSPEPSSLPQHTTTSAPSTSQPQHSQPSPAVEEHVPTPHESPLYSVYLHGSDKGRLQQTDLMILVTKLTDRIDVLEKDLQQTKKTYNIAMTELILRVKKLENKLKSSKARRRARIVLSEDEDVAEDSSKQGRKISDIDEDPNISLVHDEGMTWFQEDEQVQEKQSDDTDVLVQEETPIELVEDKSSGEKGEKEVTTPANFQTYIRRSRGVSTCSGDVSTASEIDTAAAAEKAKEKGKGIMTEPEPPKKLKKIVELQLSVDEELARKIQEKDQASDIAEQEQERIYFEAALELQRQLDERQEVPAQTQEIDWNDPSFVRYHALKNRPVSVAQARKNIIAYCINQGGYKERHFKKMSYDAIRPIFQKEEDVKLERIVKEVSKNSRGRRKKSLARKRARETLDEETSKKQKHDEEETTDYEEEELRLNLKIVPNEDDEVYYEPLSKKYPIVDFEYQLLGRMEAKDMDVYKLTRADGSSSYHGSMQAFLRRLDRQDLDNLYNLVQERFRDHPLEGHDLMLWGDLRMIFELDENNEIWKNQSDWKLLSWKLHENCGVHTLFFRWYTCGD